MAANTSRIPVLVSEDEKVRITTAAQAAGLSVGQFMRGAAAVYRPGDPDERALAAMIEQMNLATERAERAIDKALDFVAASNARIERLERKHEQRVA